MYHIFLDIRFDLQTGVPPTSPGISLHWKCPSMWTHVYCNQHDHSAWRMIPFTQSGGPPSSPCITPPQHDWKMKSSSFCSGTVSLVWLRRKFVYPPISIGPVYVRVWGRYTRVLKDIWRGPMEDKQQQEKTRRGKHSWLPLSLLTPAVGCNLHSNRTWKHCAELIFEVVIFNNPPFSRVF